MEKLLEVQLKALYDPGEKVLEIKSYKDGFLALTESSKILFFNQVDNLQFGDLGLGSRFFHYSWEKNDKIATFYEDSQGTTITMLNLNTGEKFSTHISDKVSGIQSTDYGVLYWGPSKTGLFKGYIALATSSGGWSSEVPMLQTASCWGDILYAVAYNGKVYKARFTSTQPPAFSEVTSISGRVKKIIPLESTAFIIGTNKATILGPQPKTLDLGEEILYAKAVGKWAFLATANYTILLDLDTFTPIRLDTGRVFDIDGYGETAYILTSDEIIELINGQVARRISLGGLPATILRAGKDFALYFFQILAYATVETPQISAVAKLVNVKDTGEAIYEVEALVKTPSTLKPVSGRVTLMIGDEVIEGQLDEAGRATFRVEVRESAKLSIAPATGELKPAELVLSPPKKKPTELGKGDVLVRSDGASWYLQEKLGSGGFGTVYRVLDPILERSLAVKILPITGEENAEKLRSLLEEAWFLAQASQKLNKEKKIVVEMHGIEKFTIADLTGSKRGTIYGLVMEYVEGGSLASLISTGTAPIELRINIAVALAEALARLHSEGIVHGDLKPQNVLLRQNRPLLTDFGTARLFKAAGEILPVLAYTPAYAPPEALAKTITDKSDVYSLGTMLIELFTGELPAPQSTNIPAKAVEKIRRIKGGNALCDLISRMRREKPEHRPSSQQVYEEIARVLSFHHKETRI
uniref:Serine/threonine protein kinase n=1 Tax=Thermofilum adornatum TaxID=1365176 RepID=A0A7C1CDS6_9CREN